jgi:hypothetical protein
VIGPINQGSIKGLDIRSAVSARQAWKERLFNDIGRISCEKHDHSMICCDNACSPGKWIFGEGWIFFSKISDYHKLKPAHSGISYLVQRYRPGRQ